nr:MAG TPA: hypothetical protein [Crassvirales sp.]
MWWIIGIVVYILSFFAVWVLIIRSKEAEDCETVGDVLDMLEMERADYLALLSFTPIGNTLTAILLGGMALVEKILSVKLKR